MESEEVVLNGGFSNGDFVSNGIGLGKFEGRSGFEVVNGGNGGLERDSLADEVLEGRSGFEVVNGVENGGVERDRLADEVLEGLEEYWEDINDRLMISRMVGDSVIKGMVSAVEEDAAERIRVKEMEVARIKERVGVGMGDFEPVRLWLEERVCEVGNSGRFWSFSEAAVEHDKMREDLVTFRATVGDQLEKTKKEIESARGSNSVKKVGSNAELMGLGGILPEKQPNSWLNLDRMLENLKSEVESFCSKADSTLLSSRISLCEMQHELELSRGIEDEVMQSVLKSVRVEVLEKLSELNAQYCRVHNVNWLEKLNDMSSVRVQLDSILNSLSIPEAGLASQGSIDFDQSPQKVNHVKGAFEENGALEASLIHVAEKYDFHQLKHMTKEELVKYFSNIITNLKRSHESALHQQTERYFRERREQRGPFVSHKKDDEFEVLRKKVPEVILKLDNFLSDERIPTLMADVESIPKLNDRIECLLSENQKLRDFLTNKENEMKHLEEQVSEAAAKLSNYSLAEESMRKLVADHKSAVEDSSIETSIKEEVYKCALRDLIKQKRSDFEDSDMELHVMRETYDIILGAAFNPADSRCQHEIEDLDIESSIFEGLSALLFREAIRDSEAKLDNMNQEILIEKQNRIKLENQVLEMQNESRLNVDEKERLKLEILSLETSMEQKEKLAVDLSNSLSGEKEKFEVASGELSCLREKLSQQQSLIADMNSQCESLSAKFLGAMKQTEDDKAALHKIDEELGITKKELTEAKNERDLASSLARERLDLLLLSKSQEKKLKEDMEQSIYCVNGVSKMLDNFEARISRAITKNNTRLEDTASQLSYLTKMASLLRRTELTNKQKLEQTCNDLKMAESEVDLLGDEVESLLKLLEKIFIALNHYSPILKHYRGLMEILELVRRELSGESSKPVRWQG